MKKATLFFSLLFAVAIGLAQTGHKDDKAVLIPCSEFHISKPLRELFANYVDDESRYNNTKESEDREGRKAQKFRKSVKDGPEYGNDPKSMQTTMGNVPGKSPITNWAGTSGSLPIDPSGAAGPNHYIQIVNATTFKVYNKTTGAVLLTGQLGSLFSPATTNDGDPICLYDKSADRWFLSQFGDNFGASGNKIHIAISQTADPLGSWYTYTFTSPSYPDYLKFSIWQDGYYMTSNQAQKVFAFERTAMLAGNAASRSIYKTFSPPQGSGFFVPLPGDASDGSLPPAGTPCPIFSYSDNGWGSGFVDRINIYKMAVNWIPTTPTATITSAGNVNTAAFDASYNSNWNDCPQPNTTQKLDGIGGVLTFRAQWKQWVAGYNTVVLNWGVKINTTQRSLKWCELRQNQATGVWSMYQEGIYTPDTDTRWLGSIAMDDNGAIALCYVKSNATSLFPGLYYTGRRPCDPLGTLPVTEQLAKIGTGSQTGANRDGDYSQTVLDPDGITFWHTGEYMGGSTGAGARRSQIYSFQLPVCVSGPPVANFATSPLTVCSGTSITFNDSSQNVPTTWNWSFPGGNPSTSSFQSPTVVYSTPGNYSAFLTISNSFGTDTMTSYFTVNSSPTVTVNSLTSCAGATAHLAASGADTYTWSAGATADSIGAPTATAAPTTTTAYTVIGTTNGCPDTAIATVTVVFNPFVTNNPLTQSICSGGVANIIPTLNLSGSTYHWTSNATAGLTGNSSSGTGAISDAITNSGSTVGTVTYAIVPTGPSPTFCVGNTANFVVTVNPIPPTPTITTSGAGLASSSATGNQWYLNGNLISGATGQTILVTQNGTYTVKVTIAGCSSSTSAGYNVTNAGIEEEANLFQFTVSPNPNDGNFTIYFNAVKKSNYTVILVDALGQLVFKDVVNDFSGKYAKKVNIETYAKGIYTITLTNSENQTVKKVIVY